MESCLRSFRLPGCEHTLCQLCRGKRTCGDDFGALVPFQLDPARGSAQRACDWLWGGLVENLVQIVGTALALEMAASQEDGMAKGLFESLLDFSFREYVTPRSLAFIYGLHLLAGLIAAVVLVVNGFRDFTS